MRPLLLVAAVALTLAACATGGRQPLPPVGAPPPAPVELEADPLEKYPEMLLLPGRNAHLRYVPDALDRAAHVQMRLERVIEALEKVTRDPALVGGVVLDREGWSAGGYARPWGLPESAGELVFALAATGDPETVANARALTGGWLPEIAGEPLLGTAEEAASLLVADALLQLEVAREIAASTLAPAAEPWIDALVAQVAARLAWEDTDAGQMPAIADLFDRIAAAHGGARAHRLEDYRPGLELETDLWYQAQMLRGADVVWVALGRYGCERWLRARRSSTDRLTAERLLDKFPALAAWRADSFAQ